MNPRSALNLFASSTSIAIALAITASVSGCSIGSADSASKPAATTTAGAAAPAANNAAPGLVKVELTPLPLTIQVPPGGMGAMDMSMGSNKSATVDIGDGASLNISEESHDLAAIKKTYRADTILYPFKKWMKEEGNLAIEQFAQGSKTGYIGLVLKEIGGKKYLCKTTGMDGVPSPDVATKNLKACDTLAAK